MMENLEFRREILFLVDLQLLSAVDDNSHHVEEDGY
jgi:hypothetical protein